MQYELFYLVGESKESQLDQIKEKIKKIITDEGGKFLEPEIIEKRKLAYKVKRETRGTYIAQRFDLSGEEEPAVVNKIQNINKKMTLYQNILRFIIVRASDLPELKPHEIITRDKFSKPLSRREERSVYIRPAMRKKEAPAEKPASSEEKRETKSIDEKLEEILNI